MWDTLKAIFCWMFGYGDRKFKEGQAAQVVENRFRNVESRLDEMRVRLDRKDETDRVSRDLLVEVKTKIDVMATFQTDIKTDLTELRKLMEEHLTHH